MKLKSVKLLVS